MIAGRAGFCCAAGRGRHCGGVRYNPGRLGPRLLIFAAIRYEAVAIARSLGLSFVSTNTATGHLANGRALELRVVGIRCGALPHDLEVERCRGVVMAGLAGALDPALRIGDVVVDERSDFPLPEGNWRRGAIHTASEIISTPAEKAALFRATGAQAVDMESDVARHAAAEWGVPFLGLRAVSDRADEILDPAVMRLIDPMGRLRTGRLAAELCRRPRLITDLWRLRARSGRAMAGLTCALCQILSGTAQPA